MSAQRFELIVFDFDGTLADTRPAIAATLRQLLPENCPPDAESLIHKLVGAGLPLDSTLRQLDQQFKLEGDGSLPGLVMRYRALYPDIAASHSRLFDGYMETLALIRSHGLHTALVSNKGEAAIADFLRTVGIEQHFDLLVGEIDGRPRKPDPRLLLEHVSPHFHVQPSAMLMVGDTVADLTFAQNCGIFSCWARFGYGDPESCAALKPTFTIDSPRQLREILFPTSAAR